MTTSCSSLWADPCFCSQGVSSSLAGHSGTCDRTDCLFMNVNLECGGEVISIFP